MQVNKMIYYLAHPYIKNPTLSIHYAFEWTLKLRNRGLIVFSPIMHTHYYHCYHGKKVGQEDYTKWDLDLLEACLPNVTILMSHTAFLISSQDRKWISKGCKREYYWGKEHHVRILDLEAFVEKEEEVEI
jgi:hypothetical protein